MVKSGSVPPPEAEAYLFYAGRVFCHPFQLIRAICTFCF